MTVSTNLRSCVTAFTDTENDSDGRTFIIFGVPRGGTTMIAGILHKCGLDLGNDLPVNLEDPIFNMDELKKHGHNVEERVREALNSRSQNSHVWGWKYPRAVAYLNDVRSSIKNPHLILVTRDPLACASRKIRSGEDAITAVQAAANLTRRNLNLIQNWEVPSVIVSYERALFQKRETIKALCDFASLSTPSNTASIEEFMEAGSYKSV